MTLFMLFSVSCQHELLFLARRPAAAARNTVPKTKRQTKSQPKTAIDQKLGKLRFCIYLASPTQALDVTRECVVCVGPTAAFYVAAIAAAVYAVVFGIFYALRIGRTSAGFTAGLSAVETELLVSRTTRT